MSKTLNGVPFRQILVPTSKHRIKAPYTMNAKKVTLHETDNQASAINEINYMNSNNNQTSYHGAIDDKEYIQGVPYNRNTWHAGDGGNGYGNRNTLSFEICYNYDRTRQTTALLEPLSSKYQNGVRNAIKVVAKIMADQGIVANNSNIKTHNDWNGKHCPRKMRNDGRVLIVKAGIIAEYNRLKGLPTPKPVTSSQSKKADGHLSLSQVVDKTIAGGYGNGSARKTNITKKTNYTYATVQKAVNAKLSTPAPKKQAKSIALMADEVIAGKHGQGHSNRRNSLGVNQAEYEKARAEVNRRARVGAPTPSKPVKKLISQMADEVIANKHGNGHENRRKSLGISASEYAKVRAEVNRRAGVSVRPQKTIERMAREIVDGKHGNGHANRQRSLGVDNATYQKVRARVNQIM